MSSIDDPLHFEATPFSEVGWDNLQIVETHDDKGRIELPSDDQLCDILGLHDEEEKKI